VAYVPGILLQASYTLRQTTCVLEKRRYITQQLVGHEEGGTSIS